VLFEEPQNSGTSKYEYRKGTNGEIEHYEKWPVKQLDCFPCKALTVYRLQGSTLELGYFDNSFIFGESLLYVGLSRFTDLTKIGLKKILNLAIFVQIKRALNFWSC
jgi:hypothetical protein